MANLKGKEKGTTHTTQPIPWNAAMTLLDVMKDKKKEANTRLMFACGFYTAFRIGDILTLTWGDLWGDTFRRFEQKTGKGRKISVNPDLKRIALETYNLMPKKPLDDELIFIVQKNVRDKKAISVTAANKRVAKHFEKYGITAANPSSHTLRKTFARRVYDNNGQTDAALHILSEILNHADIKTTRKYIGLTDELIKDIYLNL